MKKAPNEETSVVSIRFEKIILELIDSVAKDRGTDRSGFVRESVLIRLGELSFLSEEQKKSLGVKNNEHP